MLVRLLRLLMLLRLLRLLRILMLLMIVIESALVNSLVSAADLPNYPDIEMVPLHFTGTTFFLDEWQRAYSFGGNASVASTLLVVVLSLVGFSPILVISVFIAVTMIGSGSGWVAFTAYFFYKIRLSYKFLFVIIVSWLWITFVPGIPALAKISPKYFGRLIL